MGQQRASHYAVVTFTVSRASSTITGASTEHRRSRGMPVARGPLQGAGGDRCYGRSHACRSTCISFIQQLEGDLLYPVVVGRAIGLHPAAIVSVLTAGGVLAGIVGALVAVPVAATAWSAGNYLRRDRGPAPGTEPVSGGDPAA